MSLIGRVIANTGPTPDIVLPDGVPPPDRVEIHEDKAPDWRWETDETVALIRMKGVSRLIDAIEWLVNVQQHSIMRGLNAFEMSQVTEGVENLPMRWRTTDLQKRIICGGSIYRLYYGPDYREFVPCILFDNGRPVATSLETSTTLRPRDVFACVACTPDMVIPIGDSNPSFAPPRRMRVRPRNRSTSFRVLGTTSPDIF